MSYSIDLGGRVALVTGGSRGIGARIARTLAGAGARTVVNYRGSPEKAEEVVRSIVKAGGQAMAVQADVTDLEAVQKMRDTVLAGWGPVDILVNNAVQASPGDDFLTLDWETFETQVDGSLKALCNTGWVFIPDMQERRWGRIININTIGFVEHTAGASPYNSGKGAMYSWSRTVAREVAPYNVTINQIAPGWMATERVDKNSEASRRYAALVPMQRQGDAQEVANAVLFFASDLAGFVTGALLPVCGGFLMW